MGGRGSLPPPRRLVYGVNILGKILGNFIFFGQICVKVLGNFMSFGQLCPQNVESIHPDERLRFWKSPQFGQKKQLICRAKFNSFSSHFLGKSLVPPKSFRFSTPMYIVQHHPLRRREVRRRVEVSGKSKESTRTRFNHVSPGSCHLVQRWNWLGFSRHDR